MPGRRLVIVGLVLACILLLFPPVRSIREPYKTARTCLLSTDLYRTEMRGESAEGGVFSSIETTSIDVPRLAVELGFLAAFTALLTMLARVRAERLAKLTDPSAE